LVVASSHGWLIRGYMQGVLFMFKKVLPFLLGLCLVLGFIALVPRPGQAVEVFVASELKQIPLFDDEVS
jgi:hypothetical protein